jgi:integrase
MPEKKHAGGRPRKGTLELRGGIWCARLTTTVDGEAIRKWYPLGTDSRPAARRKMAKLIKDHAAASSVAEVAEAASKAQTVDDYAEHWLKVRLASGKPSAVYEAAYYARIWSPAIGKLELAAVKGAHISAVLNEAAAGQILPAQRKWRKDAPKPYSSQSLSHIRATAFRLFDAALRDEIILRNPVAIIRVPEKDETQKARTILTDEEINTLVFHPDVDKEIKLLVLLSRTIGGLRAGDLNGMNWTAFSPGFTTCTFVRRKTRKKRTTPETHEVLEAVRDFLTDWWTDHGKPTSGPVFPARRGDRAGEFKKSVGNSYAKRLRDALTKAGVDRHELHHATDTTLPVEFHSTRRAFVTALAVAGVNMQTSMAASGHSDEETHLRYFIKATIQKVPEAAVLRLVGGAEFRPKALPKLDPNSVANSEKPTTISLHCGTSSVGRARASQA